MLFHREILTISLFYIFSAIEVITSKTRIVVKTDPYSGKLVKTKVKVWNPTVANLSLMALGSSAPEILLNVVETVSTLGSKPGELGPSTIVGSAAFNFLIISGLSIYAVDENCDDRTPDQIKDDGTELGVKKIEDTGVFAITTIWSIIAYIWLFVVLSDEKVEAWEAWLTLGFMVLLLIMAYTADCLRRKKIQAREDEKYGNQNLGHDVAGGVDNSRINSVKSLDVIDFYNKLLPLEEGKKPENPADEQLTSEMREFLLFEFGTTKVSEVGKDQLK